MKKDRIVIKVGTSTLTNELGNSNLRTMEKLAMVLSDIQNMGHEVILVSSGAIAVGANKMHLKEKPTTMRMKQAAAAVGQCANMFLYDKFFGYYDKTVAQILLNAEDITQEEKKENLSNTFSALLESGVIPVVNENDSVSYTEIESEERLFSDNDVLSAVVAVLCQADKLVILSDIDGFFDKDPRLYKDAQLSDNRQIQQEIRWFMKKNRPSPKVFIGYDRTAYAGIEDPEFRITFDRNIRYRLHDLDLRSGDYGDPVTDDDTVIMEVKIKDAMPLWLVPILSSNRIYPGSFSKYGACYERFIAREAFKPSVFLQAQEVREAEKIKETEKIKITEEMNRTEEVKEVKKAKKTGERRRSCSAVLSGVLSPSLLFSSVLSSRWHSAS